jgi:hypothetical protein
VFRIHHRGPSGFEPVATDADGYQRSAAFGCAFRLDARRDSQDLPAFDLHVRG